MNWNKFFTGTPDHGDHGNEDETETEDDEDITDSNGTVSTDKKPHFLGMHFHKFSHHDLSQRCINLAFLTTNAAIFLAGIVGIVTSVWTLTDNRIMSRLIGQRFFITTLLFVGIIAALVSLLGILGLLRRKRKFLNIYALCYLLFLGTIFISAIMSFWIFEEITKRIQDDMSTSIETYHSSFSSREAWDNTHRYVRDQFLVLTSRWLWKILYPVFLFQQLALKKNCILAEMLWGKVREGLGEVSRRYSEELLLQVHRRSKFFDELNNVF